MELQEKVNVFLDKLRESGAINMFGAAPYVSDAYEARDLVKNWMPYVSDAFGVSKYEARDLVKNWMETFAERHPQ